MGDVAWSTDVYVWGRVAPDRPFSDKPTQPGEFSGSTTRRWEGSGTWNSFLFCPRGIAELPTRLLSIRKSRDARFSSSWLKYWESSERLPFIFHHRDESPGFPQSWLCECCLLWVLPLQKERETLSWLTSLHGMFACCCHIPRYSYYCWVGSVGRG